MKHFLNTPRLLLRPLQLSDADWCVEMLTNPGVVRYIYDEVPTGEEIRNEMVCSVRRCADGCVGIWAIEFASEQRCLGTVFLLPLPVDENDTNWDLVTGNNLPDAEIELGFILSASAWGRGIATEAAGRLVEFAFHEAGIAELVAVIDADNAAASNVLRKIGFCHEGLRRAYGVECPGFRLRYKQ